MLQKSSAMEMLLREAILQLWRQDSAHTNLGQEETKDEISETAGVT